MQKGDGNKRTTLCFNAQIDFCLCRAKYLSDLNKKKQKKIIRDNNKVINNERDKNINASILTPRR